MKGPAIIVPPITSKLKRMCPGRERGEGEGEVANTPAPMVLFEVRLNYETDGRDAASSGGRERQAREKHGSKEI